MRVFNVRLIINLCALIILIIFSADKTFSDYFYPFSIPFFLLMFFSLLSVIALITNLIISIFEYKNKRESVSPLIINIVIILLVPIMLMVLP